MTALNKYEQETIVNYTNGEKTASIYTADPVVIRKLDKLVEKYPETYKVIAQDKYSKTYECPKKMVSFRPPRILTDEQKAELRERMNKINN